MGVVVTTAMWYYVGMEIVLALLFFGLLVCWFAFQDTYTEYHGPDEVRTSVVSAEPEPADWYNGSYPPPTHQLRAIVLPEDWFSDWERGSL